MTKSSEKFLCEKVVFVLIPYRKMSSHHARTLGNVKMNKGIMFPPLAQAINNTNKSFFQEHNLMVHGDGVKGVPVSPRGSSSSGRPLTSRTEQANAKAAEELRELQVGCLEIALCMLLLLLFITHCVDIHTYMYKSERQD